MDVNSSGAGARAGQDYAAFVPLQKWAQNASSVCHHDAITHVAVTAAANRDRLLLSCARDGVVKAWQ